MKSSLRATVELRPISDPFTRERIRDIGFDPMVYKNVKLTIKSTSMISIGMWGNFKIWLLYNKAMMKELVCINLYYIRFKTKKCKHYLKQKKKKFFQTKCW